MENLGLNICKHCNGRGQKVDTETVLQLLSGDARRQVRPDVKYFLCMTPECETSYFTNKANTYFTTEQMKTPLWYKKDASVRYACYCNRVTREQVIDAIENHEARTVKDVSDITGAMHHARCKENNPLGVSCNHIIQQIIDTHSRSASE